MHAFDAKVRKWGRSLGVVIPVDIVNELGLEEGDDAVFLIQKKEDNPVAKIFGVVKKPKGWSTEKELHNARKDMWPNRSKGWR